jgi:hypothetical protein
VTRNSRDILQLVQTLVMILPVVCPLLCTGILAAALLARRWRDKIAWSSLEFLFAAPAVAIWYSGFCFGRGKTWGNLLVEPVLLGFSAVAYVLIRRSNPSRILGRLTTLAGFSLCCVAAFLIGRSFPMIPFPE